MKALLLNTAAAAALAFGMSGVLAQTSGGAGAQVPPPSAPGAPSAGASGSGSTAPSEMPNRADTGGAAAGGGARVQGEAPPASTKGGVNAQGETKQGDTKAGTSAQGEMKRGDTKADSSAERRSDGVQSGRSAAPKDLTIEQRTVIRERVIDRSDRVNIDFNISVGAVVPQTVHGHLHPLPPEIIEIYPDYRGYSYIVLSDGRLVIIEPRSYEVVTIISV